VNAADLICDLRRLGVRLEVCSDRLRYYPLSAVTPDLLSLLKVHKADVVAFLRSAADPAPAAPIHELGTSPTMDVPAARPVCRCGSTTWRDVPIHGGRSVRRDCGRCGRFLDFPVWYRNDT
jgi:hypothetical protein